MFDFETLLDWAAVALPALVAIVGVWVSIESPQLETRAQKNSWRAGLILFGILVSVVAYAQQKFAREKAQQQFVNQYHPAGILVYGNRRFTFYNKTRSTLYLWGDKLADTPKDLGTNPRVLPIDANYYLFGDKFEELAIKNIGQNGEARLPFEMYFKNELGEKYTAVFELLVIVKDGKVEVHTQMISFERSEW